MTLNLCQGLVENQVKEVYQVKEEKMKEWINTSTTVERHSCQPTM